MTALLMMMQKAFFEELPKIFPPGSKKKFNKSADKRNVNFDCGSSSDDDDNEGSTQPIENEVATLYHDMMSYDEFGELTERPNIKVIHAQIGSCFQKMAMRLDDL